MKTTTIKFNYAESLKRNGKTITKGMVKEMPKVAAMYAIMGVAGTLATTAIEAGINKKANKQIAKILNK